MQGRVCKRLLKLLLYIVCAQSLLPAQSDRANPAPDAAVSASLPPTLATLKPNPAQPGAPNLRAHLPIYAGAFGFPQMAHAAGMIFSGTVTAIARSSPRGDSIESLKTVAITFHVDQAIRGATSGQDLTISQWMGVWTSGQRYRVGERVLLFLYPPSKLGLTSCVGGPLGRFTFDATGHVLLTAQHLAAFHSDPILNGKSRALMSDFGDAVRRASEEATTR